jgi:hypothetical protein
MKDIDDAIPIFFLNFPARNFPVGIRYFTFHLRQPKCLAKCDVRPRD